MRLCEVCRAAENPIGKLRFRKHSDGKVYCENHDPHITGAVPSAPSPLPFVSPIAASAGSLVVIPCPECRGMSHKPHGKICQGCVGYGSVRVPENNLVVYRPRKEEEDLPPPPELLTEA